MSENEPRRETAFEARHATIIARTLRWADEAAARHDYVQAVHWVDTVRGLGDDVADEYKVKREAWLNAAERDGPPTGSAGHGTRPRAG
jgi:hypothetical protein